MPLCQQCGKANASESLFCEACGARMGTVEAAPVSVGPSASATSAGPPICARCGSLNEPGMGFCRLCGHSLAAAPPASGATADATLVLGPCVACGRPTPAGLTFCQNCGARVGPRAPSPAASAAAAPAPRVDPASTVRLEPHPEAHRAHRNGAPVRDPRAQGGHHVDGRSAQPAPRARGRLVVLREGRDAEAHPITSETFDVGRTEGQLLFGGDPHLAARHLRFVLSSSGAARVRPLDTVNGSYLRVAGGCDLVPGDVILVGRQLLRYESVGPEERDPPTVAEHGVRLLGSAVREAWGRLRQLTSAGTTRDLWHLAGAEVCIGRRGEVACDDPDVADRHALVRRGSGRPRLEDEGAPGGTFVRLRGERELRGGEVLRLGEQTVRFEAAGQAGA